MKVYILRGGSGAGKSTWISKNLPGAMVFSADKFFEKDGEYMFDVKKLNEAHGWCLRNFVNCCDTLSESNHPANNPGNDVAVIDNTNTRLVEFASYATIAQAYGHELQVITFIYDPVAAFKRNTHGTPLKVCMAQHQRLAEETKLIPPWWNHDYALWDETWPFASNSGDN